MEYYLLLECPKCEEEIHYGVCLTLLTHNGLPVISADNTSQMVFDCDNCGTRIYTGDFHDMLDYDDD